VCFFCGHRPASGGVGVGADTTPADPSGERGVVCNKEGEREGGGSKAQTHMRAARESTAAVRRREGGRHHATHTDRAGNRAAR
jgi:hypothetical protein